MTKFTSPQLDIESLQGLQEILGEEEVIDIVQTYLDLLPDQLAAIETAVNQTPDALREAAHALKGSSGNLGAARIADICFELESLAKQGEINQDAKDLIPLIFSNADELKTILVELIEDLS